MKISDSYLLLYGYFIAVVIVLPTNFNKAILVYSTIFVHNQRNGLV